MNLRITAIFILCVISPIAFAQQVHKVTGEYIYYAPLNVSIEQAQKTAVEKAKIDIMAQHFGTVVRNDAISVLGKSTDEYLSIGETEVKGEWLRTIGTPEINTSFEQNMLVVKVKISGEIREIQESRIDFDTEVICGNNGILEKGYKFKSGNDLYLSFLAPVSGYVAVYLYCSDGILRLLPDYSSENGSFPAEGGKPYVFFKDGDVQYELTCDGESEINRIYVIFSPNRFFRPNDIRKEDEIPVLSFEDFNKWLSRCRRQDNDMAVKTIDLLIEK